MAPKISPRTLTDQPYWISTTKVYKLKKLKESLELISTQQHTNIMLIKAARFKYISGRVDRL